jgi:hypothetical protein
MATLTAQTTDRTGAEVSLAACAAGGDEFVNTGNEFIYIENGAVAAQTVTIATPATVDGLAVADRTVEVPAGENWIFGPFPVNTYNDGNAKVQLTYSAVATLNIAVLKLGS